MLQLLLLAVPAITLMGEVNIAVADRPGNFAGLLGDADHFAGFIDLEVA